jgi:hypothetical protein
LYDPDYFLNAPDYFLYDPEYFLAWSCRST